jgi:redox-sensitive bicupin YhaK (pirin superfamily)
LIQVILYEKRVPPDKSSLDQENCRVGFEELKMITVRKSEDRRHIEGKNQETWMTFDLENSADPLQKGFGVLKILNEEVLSPGTGFILHTHKDMVVVTYVREGMIVYKGPTEPSSRLETEEFHAGSILADTKQSAFNSSDDDKTHVFQSGFTPQAGVFKKGGLKKLFTYAERKGILKLIASPDGKEASLPIEQDVHIYSTFINKGNHMIHELSPGRDAWLHVVKGHISLDDLQLYTGDGAGLSNELSVSFTAQEPTEILLFDLERKIEEETKTLPPKGKVALKVL